MQTEERAKKRVSDSYTEHVEIVMGSHLNGYGRLFGGQLLQWLDVMFGVVARRHAGCGLLVEGQPVRRKAVLRHGAVLRVGERALQLRLFAGVLLKGETPEHTMDAGESM